MVDNPWQVLGVTQDASEEEIRAAYLRKVKEHPPERSPEAFERIRDAHEALRDPRRRATRVLSADLSQPLVSLLDGLPPRREFVGRELWLRALKER